MQIHVDLLNNTLGEYRVFLVSGVNLSSHDFSIIIVDIKLELTQNIMICTVLSHIQKSYPLTELASTRQLKKTVHTDEYVLEHIYNVSNKGYRDDAKNLCTVCVTPLLTLTRQVKVCGASASELCLDVLFTLSKLC